MDKFTLLRDLAFLLRKYGPTVFSDLAAFLRDPEGVAELVSVLEAAEAAGRKAGVTDPHVARSRERDGKASVQRLLLELERDQPEKAHVLLSFHRALIARRALPTLRELRSFAVDNGLMEISERSRDKAIRSLIRDLAAHPLEEILPILRDIRTEDAADDRTLEGWANVILDKDRTTRG